MVCCSSAAGWPPRPPAGLERLLLADFFRERLQDGVTVLPRCLLLALQFTGNCEGCTERACPCPHELPYLLDELLWANHALPSHHHHEHLRRGLAHHLG